MGDPLPLGPALGLLLTGGYLTGAAVARRRLRRSWPAWRTAAFLLGALAVAVALSPPVAGFAAHDARGHMLQHLLLAMYAPLGLVLGAPVTLALGASSPGGRRRLVAVLGSAPLRVLAHPVVAAVLDIGGLFVLYLTPLYHAATTDPVVHHLVNLHLLLAGSLFTWSVAAVEPAPGRPGTTTRLGVLVVAAGAHAWLAKLVYARAAEPPLAGTHPVEQVQAAAQWMYYGGDVAEVALAVLVLAGWYRRQGLRQRRVARVKPA